ncbi:MAG: hypothetical protein E6J28_09180 [Chloroflexi bacterium]|nr:MAG: hypothetical protein E6J28_09180 [Chloroflexota bacterium]
MHLLRQLVSSIRSRPKAHLAVAFIAVSNHLSVVALAATPGVLGMSPARAVCGPDASCSAQGETVRNPNVSLPAGAQQCEDSGPAAACSHEAYPSNTAAGIPSSPAGQGLCAPADGKLLPSTSASCSDTALPEVAPARSGASQQAPVVAPSVPVASLGAPLPTRLTLTASAETMATTRPVVLTATASATVTGSDLAIEIFDQTTGVLIAACGQGSQCSIAYAAKSGTHEFAAFVTPPATTMPNSSTALPSNHVNVGWLASGIKTVCHRHGDLLD